MTETTHIMPKITARVVNCTPHAITVAGVTIPPSGVIPRVQEWVEQIAILASEGGTEIPLTRTRLGDLVGLPDPEPGTWYVVSRMTAEAAPEREDLLIPGKQIRDDQGRICGAESLSRLLYTRVDEIEYIADRIVDRCDVLSDLSDDALTQCVEDLRRQVFMSLEDAQRTIENAFRRSRKEMKEFYRTHYDIHLRD